MCRPLASRLACVPAALLCLLAASGASAAPPGQIRYLDTDSASFGSFVGVYGRGFGQAQGQISLGGASAVDYPVWSDSLVIVRVPAGASTGQVVLKPKGEAGLTAPGTLTIHTGNIYVVSTAGSDQGPGDEKQPFQSLHKALSVAVPGDTVLVHAGTYDEQDSSPDPAPALYFKSSNGGTSTKPITWRGFGAEIPVIRGAGPLARDNPILHVRGEHLRFARLAIHGKDNNSTAVSVLGNAVWLTGVEIYGFSGHGILVDQAAGTAIQGCRVHDGGAHPGASHGVLMTGQASTIRDNEIDHLANGYGVMLQYQTQSAAQVFFNYVHDTAGGGIGLSRVKGGNRVFDNVVWKTGLGQGCQCSILVGQGAGVGEASTGDNVYFNTFVGAGQTGIVLADRTGAVQLHSNIFAGAKVGVWVDDDASKTALQASHNLYYRQGAPPQFKWSGGSFLDFAAFKTSSQQEDKSKLEDPLFVAAETGDFHLGAGSPAIDSAGGPDQPGQDFDGVSRPQGVAKDMGAFERVPTDGGTPPADGGDAAVEVAADAPAEGKTDGAGGSGGTADGAAGAADGSQPDAGGQAGSAPAAGGGDQGGGDSGGCGCSTPGGSRAHAGWLALLALAALRSRARRRSR
jgi:MYXO-CTERM domain-containing protein